jgi:hypothetical protein
MPELPIIEACDQAALRDWPEAIEEALCLGSGKTLQD